MYTVAQIDEHIIGMGHSSTLQKVRNKEAMYERAAAIFNLKQKTLEQIRTMPLASTVHDDFFNYALPVDFGSIIDLIPEDNRNSWDKAFRTTAGEFDLSKAIANKTISIEGNEGIKTIRINWRSRQGKVLSSLNDVDDNGLWQAVGSAANIEQDIITHISGSGSVRFDVLASGDGIKNTTLSAVDLTDESEVADLFIYAFFPTIAALISITPVWGNDLTAKFWTGAAQTAQADGSSVQAGWNLFRIPWATAVQTGIVAPATIDSLQITVQSTGPIQNVRLDNAVFSIGRNFDLKYYSKYLFKDATTGLWISRPNVNSTDDFVLVDNDTLPVFLMELFKAMAHQIEGSDSTFDLNFAMNELKELYPILHAQTPNMTKRAISKSTAGARMNRLGRRWW